MPDKVCFQCSRQCILEIDSFRQVGPVFVSSQQRVVFEFLWQNCLFRLLSFDFHPSSCLLASACPWTSLLVWPFGARSMYAQTIPKRLSPLMLSGPHDLALSNSSGYGSQNLKLVSLLMGRITSLMVLRKIFNSSEHRQSFSSPCGSTRQSKIQSIKQVVAK